MIVIIMILWVILFYLALIYKSASLVLLSFFAAAYIVVSYVLLWIRKRGTSCDMDVPIAVMDEGGQVSAELGMQSRVTFGTSRLVFFLMIRDTFSGRKKRLRLKATQKGSGKQNFAYRLSLPEAGSYEIQLKKVRFYDAMGLLYLSRRSRASSRIQVLPEIGQVPVQISQPVRRFYGEADVYDDEHAGNDPSELFGFRPFAAGDRLQNVHWKLSAKTDELMVKENSLPKACAVVLFLDYQEGKQKRRKKTRVSSFLEIAGSLSFSLMDQGCPHYVSWYDEKKRDITRIRVDDDESFYSFFARYLTEQGGCPPADMELLYRDKYTSEHYLHSLRITQELMLYKNGEVLLDLSGKDGKNILEQTELFI